MTSPSLPDEDITLIRSTAGKNIKEAFEAFVGSEEKNSPDVLKALVILRASEYMLRAAERAHAIAELMESNAFLFLDTEERIPFDAPQFQRVGKRSDETENRIEATSMAARMVLNNEIEAMNQGYLEAVGALPSYQVASLSVGTPAIERFFKDAADGYRISSGLFARMGLDDTAQKLRAVANGIQVPNGYTPPPSETISRIKVNVARARQDAGIIAAGQIETENAVAAAFDGSGLDPRYLTAVGYTIASTILDGYGDSEAADKLKSDAKAIDLSKSDLPTPDEIVESISVVFFEETARKYKQGVGPIGYRIASVLLMEAQQPKLSITMTGFAEASDAFDPDAAKVISSIAEKTGSSSEVAKTFIGAVKNTAASGIISGMLDRNPSVDAYFNPIPFEQRLEELVDLMDKPYPPEIAKMIGLSTGKNGAFDKVPDCGL